MGKNGTAPKNPTLLRNLISGRAGPVRSGRSNSVLMELILLKAVNPCKRGSSLYTYLKNTTDSTKFNFGKSDDAAANLVREDYVWERLEFILSRRTFPQNLPFTVKKVSTDFVWICAIQSMREFPLPYLEASYRGTIKSARAYKIVLKAGSRVIPETSASITAKSLYEIHGMADYSRIWNLHGSALNRNKTEMHEMVNQQWALFRRSESQPWQKQRGKRALKDLNETGNTLQKSLQGMGWKKWSSRKIYCFDDVENFPISLPLIILYLINQLEKFDSKAK